MSQQSVLSPRYRWVDTGKAIMILLVVLYHATGWMASAGFASPPLSTFNDAVGQIYMPMFFMFSGLFARRWLLRPWREFYNRKLAGFVWLYLLWSVLELPIKWLGMLLITHKAGEHFIANQALATVLIPVRSATALWYIWVLIVFFALAKATVRVPIWVQASLASGVGLAAYLIPSNVTARLENVVGLGYRKALMFYIFFLIGCYLSRHIRVLAERMTNWAAILILAAYIAAWLTLDRLQVSHNPLVLYFLGFVGLVVGGAMAVVTERSRVLMWLGARSLPVYLAHASIIILLVSIIAQIGIASTWLSTGVTIGVGVVAVTGSLALYAYRGPGTKFLYKEPPFMHVATSLAAQTPPTGRLGAADS